MKDPRTRTQYKADLAILEHLTPGQIWFAQQHCDHLARCRARWKDQETEMENVEKILMEVIEYEQSLKLRNGGGSPSQVEWQEEQEARAAGRCRYWEQQLAKEEEAWALLRDVYAVGKQQRIFGKMIPTHWGQFKFDLIAYDHTGCLDPDIVEGAAQLAHLLNEDPNREVPLLEAFSHTREKVLRDNPCSFHATIQEMRDRTVHVFNCPECGCTRQVFHLEWDHIMCLNQDCLAWIESEGLMVESGPAEDYAN